MMDGKEQLMKWTTKLKYQPYTEWPDKYFSKLKSKVANSQYRLNYHIQPATGLLNDPNGFSYFNGQWHLFYQNFPMGPVHGLKSWFHLCSKDLVHWQNLGYALIPTTKYDNQGVYSGSAIEINNKLFILYTGNSCNKDFIRTPYQLGAWMDKNNSICKIKRPLILPNKLYTEHFRDPMVFRFKNQIYAVIGAQNKSFSGTIALYKLKGNNISNWEFLGDLKFPYHNFCYMIECPNLVFINDKPVLIFCPQGLKQDLCSYDNIYPNVYAIGDSFVPDQCQITQTTGFTNVDEGFDIYATQAFNALDGRTLAISWIGLPDTTYPTDSDGWSGCLSLVKELKLVNGKLFQYPVAETKSLRKEINYCDLSTIHRTPKENSYELEVNIAKKASLQIVLFSNISKTQGLYITIDTQNGKLSVNRKHFGVSFGAKYGYTRTISIDKCKSATLNIFVDQSVVEIYLNKGQKTITSRVFPDETQNYIYCSQHLKAKIWPLLSTN